MIFTVTITKYEDSKTHCLISDKNGSVIISHYFESYDNEQKLINCWLDRISK